MANVPNVSAAERADSRVRELGALRQAALRRAQDYRLSGQLVPGSLREELAENEQQFRQALEAYKETTGAAATQEV
jgi:hypothetical protein